MLVVTRRKGQRIVIGGDIEVIVTELSKGSVRLAIRAPLRTSILRGEVHDSIEDANRAAAAIADHNSGKAGAIAAIFIIDVLNDLFAAFVFEIDVDVGGLAALF